MDAEYLVVVQQAGADVREPTPQDDWSRQEWLTYYGHCRDYQGGLATRFASFLTQASVFATAVCGFLATLYSRDTGTPSSYAAIAAVSTLPLLIYWRLLVVYYNQIYTAGDVLLAIEKHHLKPPANVALIGSIRARASFYGKPFGRFVVWVYPPLLIVAVGVVAGIPFWLSR